MLHNKDVLYKKILVFLEINETQYLRTVYEIIQNQCSFLFCIFINFCVASSRFTVLNI